MMLKKQYLDDDSSSDDEQIKCTLKIKNKNKVKKIPSLPDKFSKLNSIVKKKYEEFSQGKSSYTILYLDEENELINLSDEEDYAVFKDFIKQKRLANAKVFITAKGEEGAFEPLNEDYKTICESVVTNNELDLYNKFDTSQAPPTERYLNNDALRRLEKFSGPALNTERFALTPTQELISKQMLESIQKQLDYLIAKDKKPEAKKSPKKIKKAKKDKKDKEKSKKTKKTSKPNKDLEIEEEIKEYVKNENQVFEKFEVIANPPPCLEFFDEKVFDMKPLDKKDFENIEDKHEFAIQPVLKRKEDTQETSKPDDLSQIIVCEECRHNLKQEVKFICSICNDYNLCEACEAETQHKHIFIKVPAATKLDKAEYDKFCQKLLGIYTKNIFNHPEVKAEPPKERDHQEAIMNQCKETRLVKVRLMNKKMAMVLNKFDVQSGIIVKKGELVCLEWEVKNFTHNDWPEYVTIDCLPSSDIILNEQLANIRLKRGEKGKLNMKFYAPTETLDKMILDVNLCLFDELKNAIGEEVRIKLVLVE
uniref:ZZ-type domain-containing protein n=1 Tax=Euplotes harpa TaxID=151035 RepID=A0A7S3NEU2_9SPIT|mmetsp:Transcript_43469/g.51166  ORF Transcript_43469/g.51166 Transcript_43469/m.51166 type:complete len:535 (+) Transcript_43469:6-1610(+)